MREITEAERQELLDEAVDAVRAWLARDPGMTADEAAKLRRRASRAVTAAVTTGRHIHTLISARLQCVGLRVAELIDDEEAYGRALAVERNAARQYAQQVARRVVTYAKGAAGPDREHGKVTHVAGMFGVTRPAVYAWLDQPDGSPAEPLEN